MEWHTTENGKYRIESLSAATLPSAMKLIREVFPNEESVAKGTGLNEDPVAAEEASIYFADALLYGVSLVAVEVATGEVASVALNKLFSTDHSEDAFLEIFQKRCTRPASQSILEFLAITNEKCNLLEECGVDCSLEILVLATDHRHRKQGLGMLLCQISIDLARKLKDGPVSTITVEDLGPDFSFLKPKPPMSTYPKTCQAMWTAVASQSIGKKLNFKVYCTFPFDQFVSGGKTYAERIGKENPFAELAALHLYEK